MNQNVSYTALHTLTQSIALEDYCFMFFICGTFKTWLEVNEVCSHVPLHNLRPSFGVCPELGVLSSPDFSVCPHLKVYNLSPSLGMRPDFSVCPHLEVYNLSPSLGMRPDLGVCPRSPFRLCIEFPFVCQNFTERYLNFKPTAVIHILKKPMKRSFNLLTQPLIVVPI